jgi:hypothetical protein
MPVENVRARWLFRRPNEFPAKELSFGSHIFPTSNSKRWEESMEQVMRPVGVVEEVVVGEVVEPSVAGISWAAVLAGAIASCALTLVLLSLGAGLGFSVVSPWSNSGVSATTFEIGTGLYFIVMAMISSAVGGYLAGRLRNRWMGVQADEVLFRDTAHGFLAWALASVLGAILLASAATSLIGGATSGAVQAVSTSQTGGPMDIYVDTLLRPNNPTADNAASANIETRRELVRLFIADFRNGAEPSAADRSYLAKLVAARTGLSPADADKRVNDVIVQVKSDLDKTRKAAMRLAIWLTLSLFIGAFSATLAATEGGGIRDGTWGKRALRR